MATNRYKVFTTRTAYFRNGPNKSKDKLIKPNEIFRIRQISKTNDAVYTWKLEKIYSDCWHEVLHSGEWERNEIDGGDPNFKEAKDFVTTTYPEAVEIENYKTEFSFFGSKEKIEKIKEKLSSLIKEEFESSDLSIYENFIS